MLLLRSIYDFREYIQGLPAGDELDKWTSYKDVGILDYSEVGAMTSGGGRTSWFESLRDKVGEIRAVERYAYASTARVNQGARLGE